MKDSNDGLSINTILQERYKIIELINTSPASKLYKGYDTKHNRYVFIKEMISNFLDPSLKQEAIEQFKCEAKILFKLKHDNLPKFEDYFDHNSNRYLVLDYIECKRLNTIAENTSGFLPEGKIVDWSIQLCDALSYLHNNKPNPIIFRDLSPQSVFLANDGKLKLIDFGISKIVSSEDAKTMGIAKTMTPHYSPIEQHAGTTDNRSDIYSLGATMYYLLTKEPPMDSVERIIEDEPMPTCNQFNKSISSPLVKIISKAMEVDKKDRYQTVEELKAELLKLSQGQKKIVPPIPSGEEQRTSRRMQSQLQTHRLEEQQDFDEPVNRRVPGKPLPSRQTGNEEDKRLRRTPEKVEKSSYQTYRLDEQEAEEEEEEMSRPAPKRPETVKKQVSPARPARMSRQEDGEKPPVKRPSADLGSPAIVSSRTPSPSIDAPEDRYGKPQTIEDLVGPAVQPKEVRKEPKQIVAKQSVKVIEFDGIVGDEEKETEKKPTGLAAIFARIRNLFGMK